MFSLVSASYLSMNMNQVTASAYLDSHKAAHVSQTECHSLERRPRQRHPWRARSRVEESLTSRGSFAVRSRHLHRLRPPTRGHQRREVHSRHQRNTCRNFSPGGTRAGSQRSPEREGIRL